MTMDVLPSFQALKQHAQKNKLRQMRTMFAQDKERFERFSFQAPHIFFDYSKNRISNTTLRLLGQLANEAAITQHTDALFTGSQVDGHLINNTEERSVLHTALRLPLDKLDSSVIGSPPSAILKEIADCRSKMASFVNAIHKQEIKGYTDKPIDTLVSIGIGGSFLGPKMVTEALNPYAKEGLQCHYIANVDSSDCHSVLSCINAETTIFLIQSKSFGTIETLTNAQTVKQHLIDQGISAEHLAKHLYAVSSNIKAAQDFGILAENIFPMWDWVGGRYSLWSAIGLPIAFLIGMDGFNDLLEGAHDMDEHFRSAPLERNMPLLMGLLGVWYHSFLDAQSHAVLPYDKYLTFLPDHLQQLDMESNGKHVSRDGKTLSYHTGPIIWGGTGTNGQHAFHQLLHQGTMLIPSDFIVALSSHHPMGQHHELLYANCLSQTQALMQGKSIEQSYQELVNKGVNEEKAQLLAQHMENTGNQPSNTLLLEKTSPHSIGALIAAYEHKVFVQGLIWGLNSFDQWGVELGKVLGKDVLTQLTESTSNPNNDASTEGLIAKFHAFNKK